MPSSNKTLHLQLNKWLGADKPKKDDFNYDNLKVDEACRALSQAIDAINSVLSNNTYATSQSLSTLSTSVTSLYNTISTHSSNSGIHVTQAEKNTWSKGAGIEIASYTGDGALTKKITLGFQPRFVFIFGAGETMQITNLNNGSFATNSGCISTLGCSKGLSLNSDGFSVQNMSSPNLDGQQMKFNTSGISYVCFIWK